MINKMHLINIFNEVYSYMYINKFDKHIIFIVYDLYIHRILIFRQTIVHSVQFVICYLIFKNKDKNMIVVG
jgi:hypothetical protein